MNTLSCFHCGKAGHFANNCPAKKEQKKDETQDKLKELSTQVEALAKVMAGSAPQQQPSTALVPVQGAAQAGFEKVTTDTTELTALKEQVVTLTSNIGKMAEMLQPLLAMGDKVKELEMKQRVMQANSTEYTTFAEARDALQEKLEELDSKLDKEQHDSARKRLGLENTLKEMQRKGDKRERETEDRLSSIGLLLDEQRNRISLLDEMDDPPASTAGGAKKAKKAAAAAKKNKKAQEVEPSEAEAAGTGAAEAQASAAGRRAAEARAAIQAADDGETPETGGRRRRASSSK